MRYSTTAEHIDWQMAIDHYYWDRMVEAYEAAVPLGTGLWGRYLTWYRFIEAEYLTRSRSNVERLTPWLQIELVTEELDAAADHIPGAIMAACDDVAQRFGWEHGPETMVSVMAIETDAPWTSGRSGFCIDKHPYEKICLPNYAVHDPKQLQEVVMHEYAHVMTLNLSEGKAPRWLDEAVAMVAGDDVDRRLLNALRTGQAPWLSPIDLSAAYGIDRRDEAANLGSVRLAYTQSAVLGKYLCSLKGEPGLAGLMRAFTNNSLWTETKIAAGLQTPVDEALREVYGLTTAHLFDRALTWLRDTGMP